MRLIGEEVELQCHAEREREREAQGQTEEGRDDGHTRKTPSRENLLVLVTVMLL